MQSTVFRQSPSIGNCWTFCNAYNLIRRNLWCCTSRRISGASCLSKVLTLFLKWCFRCLTVSALLLTVIAKMMWLAGTDEGSFLDRLFLPAWSIFRMGFRNNSYGAAITPTAKLNRTILSSLWLRCSPLRKGNHGHLLSWWTTSASLRWGHARFFLTLNYQERNCGTSEDIWGILEDSKFAERSNIIMVDFITA